MFSSIQSDSSDAGKSWFKVEVSEPFAYSQSQTQMGSTNAWQICYT